MKKLTVHRHDTSEEAEAHQRDLVMDDQITKEMAQQAGDAVFAFASMLTALPRVVPFGSAAWATPGVELATAFNAANGLSVSWDFPSGIVFPKIEGDLLAVIEKASVQEGAERRLHAAKGSKLVRALLNESPGSISNTDIADWIQYAQQLLTARATDHE